jgi:hypothetical protein
MATKTRKQLKRVKRNGVRKYKTKKVQNKRNLRKPRKRVFFGGSGDDLVNQNSNDYEVSTPNDEVGSSSTPKNDNAAIIELILINKDKLIGGDDISQKTFGDIYSELQSELSNNHFDLSSDEESDEDRDLEYSNP